MLPPVAMVLLPEQNISNIVTEDIKKKSSDGNLCFDNLRTNEPN